jgi:hypothetical protein
MPPQVKKPCRKKACNACHRRKIRCVRIGTALRCNRCTTDDLVCAYTAIFQTSKRVGKVLSALREAERLSTLTRCTYDTNDSLCLPACFHRGSLINPELVTTCADYFFARCYPEQPILQQRNIDEIIPQMCGNVEARGLILSLCGYALIQPDICSTSSTCRGVDISVRSNKGLGKSILHQCLTLQKSHENLVSPTISSVITSFFLFRSFLLLGKHNTAWSQLREATTRAHIIGMHEESHYQKTTDVAENFRNRCLYWLLLMAERNYTIWQRLTPTLQPTVDPPSDSGGRIDIAHLSGFMRLVNLFRPFDADFTCPQESTRADGSDAVLCGLRRQLSSALPAYLRITRHQVVDLVTSEWWLYTMLCFVAFYHNILHVHVPVATSAKDSFTRDKTDNPRDVISLMNAYTYRTTGIHKLSLIVKLFEVTRVLMDIMSFVPVEQTISEPEPRDHLNLVMFRVARVRHCCQHYFKNLGMLLPPLKLSGRMQRPPHPLSS